MTQRDSAELERRLQNVTEKLLAAFEELDFVHTMSQAFSRPDGVGDLDAYLLEETRTIVRADGGWVARTNREGELATTAARGFPLEVVEFLNARLLVPLRDQNALPYLIDDLPGAWVRDAARLNTTGQISEHAQADTFPRAFLAAPLSVDNRFLGVLCLGKRAAGDVFTAGESKLLSTLAVQAALFIQSAEQVEQFRAEAETLSQRVQQLESDPSRRPDISWIRGPSPSMRRVARQVEQAAGTDATVLLLGESGTGKSLVARILHGRSRRRGRAFVEVNCGAVPPGLIESELFGHARGAFTGADRARAGLFEEADGGTIFLDEVAELPLESQVKLLTVLEQHRIRRVGENRDRAVDVRVVAATNADLAAAVRAGNFREDLYYRLNVINLTVPPLRQRREDILHLADRFLADLARETNRRVEGFSEEAKQVLAEYPWPGNVRELRNIVERSLLLKSGSGPIQARDLPFQPAGSAGTMDPALEVPDGVNLGRAVREFEKALIVRALTEENGVVARAAGRLGISRTNLHNKLNKHGLEREDSWRDARQKT